MKRILTIAFMALFSTAHAAKICVEYEPAICKHELNGVCLEYTYDSCKKFVDQEVEYSSGCDISHVTKNLNQGKCDLVASCSDSNVVAGTCERGTGCYPGYYYDNCPQGYEYRSTVTTREVDCSAYGQAGKLTLEKFEYGYFQGGLSMVTSGGNVTCQKYYSPRPKASCALRLKNGERPAECYVDECAALASNPKCTRTDGSTTYGDSITVLNTDCVWISDPVNGNVCSTDPNAIASVTDDKRLYDVKVEKYSCEAQDIRSCQNKEYKMVCADGSSQLCQEIKECTRWDSKSFTIKTEKSYEVTRDYESYKCLRGSSDCNQYKSNPNCIYLGINQGETTVNVSAINGWDSNGGSKNCFIQYGTLCYEVAPDTPSWVACTTMFNNNITASMKALYPKPVVKISNLTRAPGLGNFSGCFGSGDNAYDQKVTMDLTYVDEFESYRCYTDFFSPSASENCTQVDSGECTNYAFDASGSSKAVCNKKEIYYECIEDREQTYCGAYNSVLKCNDQQYSIPNIELESEDTMKDFGNSLALLGILDDINSIWSGQKGQCSYGWLRVGDTNQSDLAEYVIGNDTRVYCNNCKGEGALCFLLGSQTERMDEKQSYELNKKGLCHYLKTECTDELDLIVGSVCLVHTRSYCCYDSLLARVLVEQSYLQLGKSWDQGCNGLTIDDLNLLDFSKMDLSEIEQELQNKIDLSSGGLTNKVQNSISNFYKDFSNTAKKHGTEINGAE